MDYTSNSLLTLLTAPRNFGQKSGSRNHNRKLDVGRLGSISKHCQLSFCMFIILFLSDMQWLSLFHYYQIKFRSMGGKESTLQAFILLFSS